MTSKLEAAIRAEPTELIAKWRVLELLGEHAPIQAPEGAPATSCEKPFFAWDEDSELSFYATQAEAVAHATETLRYCREDACHDGEWPDAVTGIKVGIVTHVTVADVNEEGGHEYTLQGVTAPAPTYEGEPDMHAYAGRLERSTFEMRKRIEEMDLELRSIRGDAARLRWLIDEKNWNETEDTPSVCTTEDVHWGDKARALIDRHMKKD